MELPAFELADYLMAHAPGCDHDLASSNLPSVPLGDLEGLDAMDLSWGFEGGSPELRRLVARLNGVPQERVLATAGTSEANLLVGLALLTPGDRVAVERPCYEPLQKIFRLLRMRVVAVDRRPEEGFGLSIQAVREAVPRDARLLVLSNLHNPTGTALDEAFLRELAALAEERGLHVLVDEIYRETAFEAAPPCALTLSDRFVVTSSPSKFYGLGGLRIGWCLAAPDVLARVRAAQHFASVLPSKLSDLLAVRALEGREATVRRNRRLLEANRPLVEAWIEEQDRVRWVPPAGATSFPRFQGDVDRLAEVARRKHGTLIAPGRFFGATDHFRLCFGMATEELAAGLEGLGRAMGEV